MTGAKRYTKSLCLLITVALVLPLGLTGVPMAGTAEAAEEVTFFSENFEGGKPPSWQVINSESCAFGWQDTDPYPRNALGGCSGTFMIADSGWFDSCEMDTQLLTPPIDCSTYSTVVLEFDHYFRGVEEEEVGDVDVKVGTVWVNKLRYQNEFVDGHVTIDLSDVAAGKTGVQIRWYYYNALSKEFWEVDNVKLSGTYSPEPPPEETALISEAFESGLPLEWEVINNGDASQWRDDNPLAREALGGCSERFMIADTADCLPGQCMDTELRTPEIDCSGYDIVVLEFDHYFQPSSSGEVADVDAWNGTAWVNLLSLYHIPVAAGGACCIVISLMNLKRDRLYAAGPGISRHGAVGDNGAVGDSGLMIRWNYYNASGNSSSFWEVDNVRLTALPPPPVGGEAYPVNKVSLLAPWITLGVVLAGGAGWYFLRRRRAQS